MTDLDAEKKKDGQNSPEGSADAALLKKIERLNELHAEARKSDLAGLKPRWEAGCEVAEVMEDEGKYGKGSVERLAEASPWSASTLYDLAKVARWKTWDRLEDSHRNSRRGFSISHLSAIVRQPMEGAGEKTAMKIRNELFHELLEKGRSVRELEERADQLLEQHLRSSGDDQESANRDGASESAPEDEDQEKPGTGTREDHSPASPRLVTLRHANGVIAAALELSASARDAWAKVRVECTGTLQKAKDRKTVAKTLEKVRADVEQHYAETLKSIGAAQASLGDAGREGEALGKVG